MIEKIAYAGWPNCYRVANPEIELVATADAGPRIIRAGFRGERNLFFECEPHLGLQGGGAWNVFGGHRLWHAPEADPRTYNPDNSPVAVRIRGDELVLIQPVDPGAGVAKEIAIRVDPTRNAARVVHRIWNRSPWAVELAPWALSVMAAGGEAILPQEEFRHHEDYLLPARPVVLWHYTDMADPRFTWGKRFLRMRQDPRAPTKQKIGLLNRQGWAGYHLDGVWFVKQYPGDPAARYPDFGCNTELFTNPGMLELETLGPLARLEPGACAEHTETWLLHRAPCPKDEDALAEITAAFRPGPPE